MISLNVDGWSVTRGAFEQIIDHLILEHHAFDLAQCIGFCP